ncbi:hypothetical protein ABT56_01795 [Photobacterium aquae]|uniref:DUF945 domain-containing protein n=1 Tax=Photobacterium aquae TaxID=1195763 RepID=A0A0J1K3H3_9GAMM|nr:DUF945 family protein [Photobacterium aquae]KLV08962.1 hypothetical protein ABT56_01795 [Photobacterium aquae]
MLKQLGAAGGAVAIALCWPFATGQIGERIYLDTVAKYDNPYLAVTNESYQRGYLSSEALSKITLKDELKLYFEDEGLPTVWEVRHHIQHGLFGVSTDSELVVDPALQPIVAKMWGQGVSPVVFTTDTALTRKTDFTFEVLPAKAENADGTEMDFAGFSMSGNVDADGAGEFAYQLPSAVVTTVAQEAMVVKGLSGGGKGHLDGQYWIGTQTFDVNSLTFKDASSDQQVSINGLSVGMENKLTEPGASPATLLTNSNSIKIKQLVSLDGGEFNNFNFAMSFSGLDYPSMSTLGSMADKLDDTLDPQQIEAATQALDMLVEKGLTFSISDLSVDTPQGDIDSHLRLTIEPGMTGVSNNIERLAEQLAGEISIKLPVELVESNPALHERATILEQSAIAERNASHYLLNMKIDGDKIILASGDQLPLHMLFMLFM